jgi:periplasmic protein TonB
MPSLGIRFVVISFGCSLIISLQPMKKILFLSIAICFFSVISFAQYIVKPAGTAKGDTSTLVASSKKSSDNSPSAPITGATKTVVQKSAIDEYQDEDELDEKELDELEASIAKAKATLGLKSGSTTTSSKSVPSRNKEPLSKVEEQKPIAPPTTTYDVPTLMPNGRAANESNKPKIEFRQTVLTQEEKNFYNEGGLKVNNEDEIERDSIYVSPTIPPSFTGGIEAMRTYFAQNLKIPEVLKGQEIKGRVFVRFIVRKDGRLDKVHLVKGPNDECNAEAIRVIKSMPVWTPAMDRGDAVSSYHVLPISFTTAPAKK